ncbi:MAG: type II secretion system F family protein [Solirubrobacterales bacterium]|nr:type II secretion system F family protein [Solirubrobacterales bacterium]
MSGAWPALFGGLAATLAVAAIGEILRGNPGAGGGGARLWIGATIEPLRRARAEGYAPTSDERLRLAAFLGLASVACGWWLVGPMLGLALAIVAPLVSGWLISRGRRRFRRSFERALPEVARAIADCLSAGHSPRGALAAAADSLDGAARNEFRIIGRELEAGTPTGEVVRHLRDRFGSPRVDAFATALISQQLAGGDLAALLRRFAEGAAERDRVEEDARSATAQARFTGYLVVSMPVGAALFTELIRPGFFASILGSAPALVLVAISALLQLTGFMLISRLARIGST